MKWTFIFLCTLQILYGQELSIDYGDWQFQKEGSQEWSMDFPYESGTYWLKLKVEIKEAPQKFSRFGLGVSMLASHEAYWDGELIGDNGKVGISKADEVAGKMMSMFFLSNELLSAGTHEIKLRYSNYYANNQMRYYGISVLPYEKTLTEPLIVTSFIHIYAGFFLIIALYYFVRFIVLSRNWTNLFFSMLCLSFFLLIIVEYSKTYYIYPYPFHFVRLKIIFAITLLIGISMPLYFFFRFEMQHKINYILIPIGVYIALVFFTNYGYDYVTNLTMISGLFASSFICIYAFVKKWKQALLLLISVLPLTLGLVFWYRYYDFILYIGFGNLILLNLVSLAIREMNIQNEKEAALETSTRLKLDLLKKNIQPHFINNSLTSAIDWIERNPQKGVEFLFALSKEFDILLEISEKALIPISKEIDLCRSHLEIMSFRKEENYSLETQGIDEYDLIPPAIFLTIIENGITHQESSGEGLKFTIKAEKLKNKTLYHIESQGSKAQANQTIEAGTGTKYIEARLQESFPNKWTYISHAIEDGWSSTIGLHY